MFVTSYTCGNIFSKVSFVRRQTPSEINIFKNSKHWGKLQEEYNAQMIVKLNVSIFDDDWNQTKLSSDLLKIGYFQSLNLIAFGILTLLANEVQHFGI